jgi:hypothetical protein
MFPDPGSFWCPWLVETKTQYLPVSACVNLPFLSLTKTDFGCSASPTPPIQDEFLSRVLSSAKTLFTLKVKF